MVAPAADNSNMLMCRWMQVLLGQQQNVPRVAVCMHMVAGAARKQHGDATRCARVHRWTGSYLDVKHQTCMRRKAVEVRINLGLTTRMARSDNV